MPDQLLADDGQHLRAHLVQPVHAFGPDVKGAGAVVDLAVAFDADEYPRAVQQQRRTIHALSDEIGVQC